MPKNNQALRTFQPGAEYIGQQEPEAHKPLRRSHNSGVYWVGLDGEGVTEGEPSLRPDFRCAITGTHHRYISMSYANAAGVGDSIEDRSGLSTKDCLEFILSIPPAAKIAAFGFGYDATKMLEDLPDELIYLLTHPEKREYAVHTPDGKVRICHRPVMWSPKHNELGYALDLFNTRLKIGRLALNAKGRPIGKDWRTINDIIAFYQCKFVTACKRWDVGTPAERNTMRLMKDDRRNLARYTQEEILAYSEKECAWAAELAQKLDDACDEIGVQLRSQYFGAGSIAKALLRTWGIKAQMPLLPKTVELIAPYAFFGGRFEISRRGKVAKRVHDWDISSAYPYQIYNLPCLMCGKWSQTRDIERVRFAQAALCNYKLTTWKKKLPPWGPFPFRDQDGSIPFPIECGGGWIHKDEFLQGMKMWPNVKFLGAWVYETSCDHRPFEKMREIYLERLRIGKEGAGIVLKLGANAVAGNTMQLIGSRPFYQPIWAGMITSGTRCNLLEMLEQHEKWSDVIMMATDGLWGLADVTPPKVLDTGTDIEVIEEKTGKPVRKPLGAWEHDVFEKGVFMARPGIYFPLDLEEIGEDEENEKSDDKMKNLKARGIGIRTLYKHRHKIMAHYEATNGKEPYMIGDDDPLAVIRAKTAPQGVERFVGLRGGIIPNYEVIQGIKRATYKRRDVYGRWSLQHRMLSFDSLPKRTEGNGTILRVRRMPKKQKSKVYEKATAKMTIDQKLQAMTDIGFYDLDQADGED